MIFDNEKICSLVETLKNCLKAECEYKGVETGIVLCALISVMATIVRDSFDLEHTEDCLKVCEELFANAYYSGNYPQ